MCWSSLYCFRSCTKAWTSRQFCHSVGGKRTQKGVVPSHSFITDLKTLHSCFPKTCLIWYGLLVHCEGSRSSSPPQVDLARRATSKVAVLADICLGGCIISHPVISFRQSALHEVDTFIQMGHGYLAVWHYKLVALLVAGIEVLAEAEGCNPPLSSCCSLAIKTNPFG